MSRWCVYDGLSRENLKPKKQGRSGAWKLDDTALVEPVKQVTDAYQRERAEALGVS